MLGLWLIDLLEHHKIDPMLSVYQFILKSNNVFFLRIGVYDGRDTFFEGVQAGRLDYGLWELFPLGESVREKALLDVVSLIECQCIY